MSKITITAPELTEQVVMDWFRRIADAKMKLAQVEFESNMFCMSSMIEKEIHMSNRWFEKVSELLQATTTYDPTWDRKQEVICAYFYVFIAGQKWKVFSLLDR